MRNSTVTCKGPLSQDEARSLAEYEKVVERGVETFVEVGDALEAIRDGKLYRAEYRTFEEYCQKRWGFCRDYAYKLIRAAEVVENVDNCLQGPLTESQARELGRIPEDRRQDVLDWAIENAITLHRPDTSQHASPLVSPTKRGFCRCFLNLPEGPACVVGRML